MFAAESLILQQNRKTGKRFTWCSVASSCLTRESGRNFDTSQRYEVARSWLPLCMLAAEVFGRG